MWQLVRDRKARELAKAHWSFLDQRGVKEPYCPWGQNGDVHHGDKMLNFRSVRAKNDVFNII